MYMGVSKIGYFVYWGLENANYSRNQKVRVRPKACVCRIDYSKYNSVHYVDIIIIKKGKNMPLTIKTHSEIDAPLPKRENYACNRTIQSFSAILYPNKAIRELTLVTDRECFLGGMHLILTGV